MLAGLAVAVVGPEQLVGGGTAGADRQDGEGVDAADAGDDTDDGADFLQALAEAGLAELLVLGRDQDDGAVVQGHAGGAVRKVVDPFDIVGVRVGRDVGVRGFGGLGGFGGFGVHGFS